MIESVGKTIHLHRVAQKLTIAKLAERADVSDSFISRIELGTVRDTHVSKLNKVAKALNLSLADLFSQTDNDPYTTELISKLEALPKDKRTITSKTILDLIALFDDHR
ncbi:helix-turn-helix transcriptional regulator [Lacticaseibacillus zeae]|uniref:Helix-turn-helix transcriptional regulator n=1 Tax=Lacticaseibacillus zeae TaxID=57037 RepID=A0A5R8LSD2_LACZE|nr:helix-turn-helix transcriptional regulator [Lacticaseibacillus zeae]TLF40169.1 helix-turn-helix transcriptional regulator [Lacticaseibacillus zeae]